MFATLVAGTHGCARESSEEQRTVRDSAGVRIVESRAPMWPDGAGWRVEPTPILDIGGDSAALQYVQLALRLDDGRIVLANAEHREWRLYDRGGRLLHRRGGVGVGPGEFATIDFVGVLAGDSLLFLDRDGARLSLFTSDGTFVRTMPLPDVKGSISDMRSFSDGTFAVVSNTRRREGTSGPFRRQMVLYRASRDGSVVDSIRDFADEETFTRILERGRMDMPIPFGKRAAFGVHDTLAFLGTADSYEIRVYGQSGALHRVIRWAGTPKPVTKEMLDAYEREQALTYPPAFVETFHRNFAATPKPSALPPYDKLVVDRLGNLWVREYPSPGQQHRWIVFDTAGQWLGRIPIPDPLDIMQVGSDFVLGVMRDDEQGERVRLYTLTR